MCKSKVKPEHLNGRPLLYRGSSAGQKPHKSELCEMCQELGYNCREASEVSAGHDGGVDDDDRSVYLEASTSRSSSMDDRDLDDITPVASEVEDEDDWGKKLDTALKFD